MAAVKGPKNDAELIAMMARDLRALGEAVNNAQETIAKLAYQNEMLSKGYMMLAQQVERDEHFLFSVIHVALKKGLEYPELQASMEEYPKHQDLMVFWGLRTQEEYDALVAAHQAQQAAAVGAPVEAPQP